MGDSEYIAIQFAALLDVRLGLATGPETDHDALSLGSEVIEDIEFALSLWPADFQEQSEAKQDVRARLRTELESIASEPAGSQVAKVSIIGLLKSLAAPRWRLVQAALGTALVLILLQAFQVPVWASLQRLVGSGYAPRAGFVPLEGSMILPRPVLLGTDGGGIEIEQIVVTESSLEIWIESRIRLPLATGLEITLPDGESPELMDGYETEMTGSNVLGYLRYRGKFDSPSWIDLRLRGFETRRVPLQRAAELLAPLRDLRVCDSHSGISVCAVALTVERDLTCSLIQISLQDAALVDGFPTLVGDPMERGSTIDIRSAAADGSVSVRPEPQPRALQVSGDRGTYLQQLCFQVHESAEDMRLQIPGVEVILPMANQLLVPVLSPEEGWVDLDERIQWPTAEIAFEQGRAFPGEGGVMVVRVLGIQNLEGIGPIVTAFTPAVARDGGIVQIGSSHDPANGLHTIDIWVSGDREGVIPSDILIEIRNPHLTFLGPYQLDIGAGIK